MIAPERREIFKLIIYKEIPNCDLRYFAGDDGNIYKDGKKMKKSIQSSGRYYIIGLKFDGIYKTMRVHRLICMAFHGFPINNKLTVSHKDGNWRNNKPENLEWLTLKDNHAMKKLHGTDDTGIKNSRASIKDIKILRKIRKLLDSKKYTHQKIGEMFNLNRISITKIANGYRYKGQG